MPTVDEPHRPGDKVWDEIEEILDRDERREPERIRIARPTAPRRVRSGMPIWYPTPEKLMAAGLLLMVVAVIVRQFVLPLVLVGFILAGLGYYGLISKKRRSSYGSSATGGSGDPVQYWRGRPVSPMSPPKRRDGNIIEFPGTPKNKARRRFGRKK